MNKFFNFSSINKLIFLLKKPRIVIFIGGNRKLSKKMFLYILKKCPGIKKDLLVLESNLEDIRSLKFFIKNSSFPLLVITNNKNISIEKIKTITKENPGRGFLISNYDEEQNRESKIETPLRVLQFGLQPGADFQASDIKSRTGSEEMNFKINRRENIVPIWLKDISGEEYIYAVLIASAIGEVLGLNLVEISEALKDFKI